MTALDELELRANIRVMEGRIHHQQRFVAHYQREGQLRLVDRTRAILAVMLRDFRTMQLDLATGRERAGNRASGGAVVSMLARRPTALPVLGALA